MPLLDVVQRTCDEIGLPRPSAVAASSDQLARQMFGLANTELEELSKRFDWPILTRGYTFPTVIGIAAYALPADYRKFLSDTLYDGTQMRRMRGSVPPGEWQRIKQQNLGLLSYGRVRIYGRPLMINVLPIPSAVDNVVFEYITKNYAVSNANVEQPRYVADDDTAIIDETLVRMGLKWRIKHAKGLEFSADLAEYEGVVAREFASAMAAPSVPVGFSRISDELPIGYMPDGNFPGA